MCVSSRNWSTFKEWNSLFSSYLMNTYSYFDHNLNVSIWFIKFWNLRNCLQHFSQTKYGTVVSITTPVSKTTWNHSDNSMGTLKFALGVWPLFQPNLTFLIQMIIERRCAALFPYVCVLLCLCVCKYTYIWICHNSKMINCKYNYIDMGKTIYRSKKGATRNIGYTHVVFSQNTISSTSWVELKGKYLLKCVQIHDDDTVAFPSFSFSLYMSISAAHDGPHCRKRLLDLWNKIAGKGVQIVQTFIPLRTLELPLNAHLSQSHVTDTYWNLSFSVSISKYTLILIVREICLAFLPVVAM